jgi:hypothetical protein
MVEGRGVDRMSGSFQVKGRDPRIIDEDTVSQGDTQSRVASSAHEAQSLVASPLAGED